eukprot:6180194-Pleurochrysis_carterae.AAC.1
MVGVAEHQLPETWRKRPRLHIIHQKHVKKTPNIQIDRNGDAARRTCRPRLRAHGRQPSELHSSQRGQIQACRWSRAGCGCGRHERESGAIDAEPRNGRNCAAPTQEIGLLEDRDWMRNLGMDFDAVPPDCDMHFLNSMGISKTRPCSPRQHAAQSASHRGMLEPKSRIDLCTCAYRRPKCVAGLCSRPVPDRPCARHAPALAVAMRALEIQRDGGGIVPGVQSLVHVLQQPFLHILFKP